MIRVFTNDFWRKAFCRDSRSFLRFVLSVIEYMLPSYWNVPATESFWMSWIVTVTASPIGTVAVTSSVGDIGSGSFCFVFAVSPSNSEMVLQASERDARYFSFGVLSAPFQRMPAEQHRAVYHWGRHQDVLLPRLEGVAERARLSAWYLPFCTGQVSEVFGLFPSPVWQISKSAPARYRGGLLFRNKPVRLCRKNVEFSMCFRVLLTLPYHASGPKEKPHSNEWGFSFGVK